MTGQMVALAGRLRSAGTAVYGIGGGERLARACTAVLPGPPVREELAPIPLIVPGQLLVGALALRTGLDPDSPRGLTKVTQTVLDDPTHDPTVQRRTPMAADQAASIVAGLGGAGNIVDIEPCITRLRTEVRDAALVDDKALKAAGAHGVLRSGTIVQVVVGPQADTIASDIADLLE
jgi:PTS system N-acetylglucosamine-specific IIB component